MSAEEQSKSSDAITLGFVGYATAATAERASAYENEALELLERHGARLLFRGRRATADDSLPLEIQLLWFPGRAELEAFLADEQRQQLLDEYGDVFTAKHSVELTNLSTYLGRRDRS